MAGNKRSKQKKRKGGGGPAVSNDPASIAAELLAEAQAIDVDPAGGGARWGVVHRLMLRAKTDPGVAGRIVAGRDLGGLRRLAAALAAGPAEPADASDAGTVPPGDVGAPPPADGDEATDPAAAALTAAADAVTAEVRKRALAAFKKRLKLTRLDHESKLGVGPMTGGKAADVDAIMPPREFGEEVWAALIADGRLAPVGKGFYRLLPT